jgi:hypothetical protein
MLDPDPDPYKMNTDLQPCIALKLSKTGLYKLLLKPKKLDPWIVFPLTEYLLLICYCFSAEKSGILAKIGAKKTVFREPRGSGDSDKVLHDYSKTIRWVVTNQWLVDIDTMLRTGTGLNCLIIFPEFL